ncbi:mitochondrial fission process protein 1 isoform X2 [Chelonoidis abingdonii]|uniref:mitochondrial fission process protein 1 isoform X2 n=1 Tax=Chelonoidis abingdonii TaxID=106734 RepID=UPI003F491B84
MGPPAETDLYRDTWVRYLGYANEVGESFRAIVPISLVWASYGVATTYVMADAIDKGKKAAVWYIPLGALPYPLPAVLPRSSSTGSLLSMLSVLHPSGTRTRRGEADAGGRGCGGYICVAGAGLCGYPRLHH